MMNLCLLMVFIALLAGCCQAANAQSTQNVSLGGHTFAADLPNGWTTDTTMENAEGPRWEAGTYDNFDVSGLMRES